VGPSELACRAILFDITKVPPSPFCVLQSDHLLAPRSSEFFTFPQRSDTGPWAGFRSCSFPLSRSRSPFPAPDWRHIHPSPAPRILFLTMSNFTFYSPIFSPPLLSHLLFPSSDGSLPPPPFFVLPCRDPPRFPFLIGVPGNCGPGGTGPPFFPLLFRQYILGRFLFISQSFLVGPSFIPST